MLRVGMAGLVLGELVISRYPGAKGPTGPRLFRYANLLGVRNLLKDTRAFQLGHILSDMEIKLFPEIRLYISAVYLMLFSIE